MWPTATTDGRVNPRVKPGDGYDKQGSHLMPKVVITGDAGRRFTGGRSELEVAATTFRRLVLELDQRFPGLGRQVEEGMAVAIDGEIFQDAYAAQLRPDSEIVLIPKIGGG
jgi:molybdopterin converting factor small subunit